MRSQARPRESIPRLDPWILARKLAETLLLPYPETLNRVLGYVRARDVKTLASLGQPLDSALHLSGYDELLAQRQLASLFKKNDAFADDTACSAAAELTFKRGERKCRITNKRLDHYFEHPDRLSGQVRKWLSRMERDISDLLGDVADVREGFLPLLRLTNGATEDRPRRRALPFLKITGKIRAPRAAIPHIARILPEMGVSFSACKCKSVESNSIVLVPKNWKTHRTIAKEPTHSLPFQLALDNFLKKKLRRWGVDLSSQAKNQELAKQGSRDGSLATLDLEMASDTLSYNAVAWMLPLEWMQLFSAFRSSSYVSPWGEGTYAKYSSMGNGYTFTLETLIFTAACRAVGSKTYAVYGDDIVCETHLASSVIQLLRFLGFIVNKDKSFVNPESRFRESCGHDYLEGRRVTPFYLRECPRLSDKSSLSHVINGLVQVTYPVGPFWGYLREIVESERLRLVPWNEDTRSGVFITPHAAWVARKLKTDRRKTRKGQPSSTYGFPVFEGYGQTQDVRKTFGWRSLFLWHLNASYGGEVAAIDVPMRTSALLLASNASARQDGRNSSAVSRTSLRSRYVHKMCRYVPPHVTTPSILFLWDEVLGMPCPARKSPVDALVMPVV